MRVQMVADHTDREGGYVAERLVERGGVIATVDRDRPFGEPAADVVLVLGSHKSVADPRYADAVEAEITFLHEALGAGIPVIGICYGAQITAVALGGSSARCEQPEYGLVEVSTDDAELCPPGPWPTLHRDTFEIAPTSRLIASTPAAPQCFVDEAHGAPVIAWQFHPEVTPDVFARWAGEVGPAIRATGADPDDLVRHHRRRAPAARHAAFGLTDAALTYVGVA